jgi:hypothetical protein
MLSDDNNQGLLLLISPLVPKNRFFTCRFLALKNDGNDGYRVRTYCIITETAWIL